MLTSCVDVFPTGNISRISVSSISSIKPNNLPTLTKKIDIKRLIVYIKMSYKTIIFAF